MPGKRQTGFVKKKTVPIQNHQRQRVKTKSPLFCSDSKICDLLHVSKVQPKEKTSLTLIFQQQEQKDKKKEVNNIVLASLLSLKKGKRSFCF